MKHLNSIMVFFVLFLFTLNHKAVFAESSAEKGKWDYEITPYLWLASIDGSTASSGNENPIDTDYKFFSVDNLDGVFSIRFSANTTRWGIITDLFYVSFVDGFTSNLVTSEVGVKGNIIELTGTYRLNENVPVHVIAGARYQDIRSRLTINGNTLSSSSATWTDPFLGAIYLQPISRNWTFLARADMGGFGINSDKAINLETGFDYQFNHWGSAKLRYRYLRVDFKENGFLYDLSVDGLLFGLGINF